ncbi:pilus assembly protein CpaC [Endobacter medicaginis]|uniref:Pilus assembly protein CpaC n=1 Tax=Endobacter medicaginis TaxID=1181271 RepID=A0A839UZP5_9PROT|nr:type II and III secretion system protein family protein [Endobacter medicaginis]MBB3175256.1 pilus assembly protein CpaC [Endobacter medicaginis]MCX5476596.1 type II and III secretion system protein family protein [Endobacter medicaginis]
MRFEFNAAVARSGVFRASLSLSFLFSTGLICTDLLPAVARAQSAPTPIAPAASPGQAYSDPEAIAPTPPAVSHEVGTISARRKFTLTVGGGKLLNLPVPASAVFVADPSIADVNSNVNPSQARNIIVFGKKPGTTTLFAVTGDGKPILAYNVVVEYDQSALQRAITDSAPGSSVQLSRTPHGLVLSGSVPTAEASANLQAIAQRYAGNGEVVLNQLQVAGSVQVNLRVRVAEVSRDVSRQLGFNWTTVFSNVGSFALGVTPVLGAASSALNASGAVSSIFGSYSNRHGSSTLALDAMADEGLVTLLAEPNLTTSSGEQAKFLAGGEYPIPVPQGLGAVAIEYKQYGVSVSFTPTVLSSGMISMRVSPEVSQIDNSVNVNIPGSSGGTVPSLTTRRADTTVQLASGQSFAIGGLIENDSANSISKVPWLGDLPILGALFRSTTFQRHDSDLVIVVTAYIVHPTDKVPELPTDYLRQTTDLERLFLDRLVARGGTIDPERTPHLRGAVGFLFQ